MALRKAAPADLESVKAFYEDVVLHTPGIGDTARWTLGNHPSPEGLESYVRDGRMHLWEEDGAVVGAVAITPQAGDYHPVRWARDLRDDEVHALHILAVSPRSQGRGIASAMVRDCVRIAREAGAKALRLDTLVSNIPARRLYEGLGFVCRGTQYLYGENTGWMDFLFYEYAGDGLPS